MSIQLNQIPRSITESSQNESTSTDHTHAIDKASVTQAGIVKLVDNLDSTSKTEALTANQGRELAKRLNLLAQSNGSEEINSRLESALSYMATRYTAAYATYEAAKGNLCKHPENSLIYVVNDPTMANNGLWTVVGGRLIKAPWDALSSALTSEPFEVLQSIFQGAAGEQIEYEGKTYDTLATFTQTLAEGKSYIQDVLIDLAQSNNFTASYLLTASGKFQEEVNKYIPKPFLIGYTYGLNERVMLDNGAIVRSVEPSNTNNPNSNLQGWVFDFTLLIEYFGAKENSENSDAIQAAFDYLRSIGGGSLSTNIKKMSISKRCVYHDKTTMDFNKCQVTFTDTGQIVSALYNADRSLFTSMGVAEVYYKYQASRSINNPNSRITSDANTKSQSLIVASATGFAVGDYVLVSNGYCDMWRVMEKYESEGLPVSRSFQDWVRPDVDLWRCEIAKIKSITGTTIVFEDCLENDYKAVPKTYGFFSDENNRADHQTWNYPFIERLGGASNCTFKNIIANNQGTAEVAILGYCGVNNNVVDSQFKGKGQGVDFITCFNSHILNNFSDTESFGQSIRRGSNMCVLANASANYVSGDCPLIIWEGASRCTANNLNIDGTGGDVNHAKIGFYFNTCWNNVASSITGKNLETVVGVMFCRGGNITTNLVGTNCGALFNSYASFDDFCGTGILQGTYKDLPSAYDSALFVISETNNTKVENLKHRVKYSASSVTGRAHIHKSFGIELDDIDAPNIILWNSVDDDKKYDSSKFKMKTRDSVFKSGIINQSYNDGENQTRRSYLKSTDFLQDLSISNTHNTELREVKVLGRDRLKSLVLTISHFTRLIDCEIYNQATGIDFRGDGQVGSENWTSLVYMRNTVVDSPTKFLNYVNPSDQISIDATSPKSKGVKYISILTNYPQVETYANPAGDGNATGWFMVENTKNLVIESYTSAELEASNNAINAVGNKWLGREVFNTTANKFMRAIGSASTSAWISEDGTTTITPA